MPGAVQKGGGDKKTKGIQITTEIESIFLIEKLYISNAYTET